MILGLTDAKDRLMAKTTCSVPGCDRNATLRGWCQSHYSRWRRTGDVQADVPLPAKKRCLPRNRTLEERLMSFVAKPDSVADACYDPNQRVNAAHCWLWTGAKNPDGYPQLRVDGKAQYAHRISYELHVGPIPEGMFLDHICHVTSCINPCHLRPVTNKQNMEHVLGARPESKSGILGVSWSKASRKWRVAVGHNGRHHHGGLFVDIAEAEAAAIALRKKLFTHNDADYAE